MESLKVARSYVSLEKAGALLGTSAIDLIHAGAFNQVQICANLYGRSAGLSMRGINTAINCEYTDIDAESREEAQAHDKIFCDWIDRLRINVMPAGIYEVRQEDLRLFEMPENESIELGEAYKSDDHGLWEIEFDPPINAARSDLVILTTEIERIHQSGGINIKASDRPVSTRERDTLLTIIAVLAKAAKVPLDDYSKPGKAAGYIEGLTDEFGAHVSKRAIEEHLKKIADALRVRLK